MLSLLLAGCDPATISVVTDSDTASVGPDDSQPDSWRESDPLDSIPPIDDSSDDSDPPDTDPPDPDDERLYQEFFDRGVIQEIRLELTDDAIDDLNQDGREWVECDVEVNGVRFDGAGVHLKGSSTYQDFRGKPAFKIELDGFNPGQRYGALERITLNNMTGDASQIREVVAYRAWEEAGMVGPKANFARVYVNDELFGLYTNIETMDDRWAPHRYADGSGDLWDTAPDGADFTRSGLSRDGGGDFLYWDLQAGTGTQDNFFAIQDEIQGGSGDWFVDMDPYLNTDQYLDFWAWSVVMGTQDGYPFHLNDILLYVDPDNGGRFDTMPWGFDETWDSSFVWYSVAGQLSAACINDPACVAALTQKMSGGFDVYDTMDITGWMEEAAALIAQDIEDDPRRPYNTWDVAATQQALIDLQLTWSQDGRVRQGL